ncbi:MAG: Type I transmembrane sorting receptor [Vezdaea aestivalis]|nr:MAG: Type I transmembrane sorting receptor [Vezdaea aestivalis]
MHIYPAFLVTLGTFTATCFAIPLERRDIFTIIQTAIPVLRNGPASFVKALGKYGTHIPPDLRSAVAGGSGTVTATPEANDVEYLCPVSIGGQILNLDFDTGSSDLQIVLFYQKRNSFRIFSPTTQSQGNSVYNPSQSSTFRRLNGYTWKIQYGDGSYASGDVGTDMVSIGGASVAGQAVELATTVSDQFSSPQSINSDGLLGLRFSNINTVRPVKQKTFFDNVKPSLAAQVFTADLKRGTPGSYDFGFIDSRKYTGAIAYTPVDSSQGFWQFTSSGYAIGTGSIRSLTIKGIANTGTTLLLTEDSIVQAYYGQVSGAYYDSNQGGYVAPCRSAFPSFSFLVGGTKITIAGVLINFAPIDSVNRSCFGGIQSNNGLGLTIFGDILFKSKFVIFDGAVPRLGFANKS